MPTILERPPEVARPPRTEPAPAPPPARAIEQLWKTEDWWAVWLGLLIVVVGLAAYWGGSSIKSWAVVPGTWSTTTALAADFARNSGGYLLVFLMFGLVFTLSMAVMGRKVSAFIPGFIILFLGALGMLYLAGWTVMKDYDLGAPLLALLVGLAIGNVVKLPEWFKVSLRTEYYIKTGIVLLGATLPLTLIFTAGPFAFLQATIVSVTTWLTIYLAATKIFKLEPQFGAVLGAGGAVCGVSASIAVGGAVKAKKDHIAIGIAVVSIWAIVMIFVLTFVTKAMIPTMLSPGEAGAWVGTSEFADAAGFAVVAEIANKYGDSAINAFTLMKVIGRDIWIGIWCLVLSIVSVTIWERGSGQTSRLGPGIIWDRFPKFVLGFFAASIIMSFVAAQPPAGFTGRAKAADTFKSSAESIKYDADFSTYVPPPALADRFRYDADAKVITFNGAMTLDEQDALAAAIPANDPDRADKLAALKQLRYKSDWFESSLTPDLISPIKKLREWAFVICFLGIGLSTRFADLATFGLRPFWAFTIGVLVNVPLGYFLSTVVFKTFWSKL
ncbi:MAG: putative sulfate exporter family transporter [Vicinamibacteraceae bacterium]|nr:putative sulfate exporter family transporter [Vicinamibacteraceae bacterium]